MKPLQILEKTKNEIDKANHLKAFELLETIDFSSDLRVEFEQIKARHTAFFKEITQGTLTDNDAIVQEANQISQALTQFVSAIELEIKHQNQEKHAPTTQEDNLPKHKKIIKQIRHQIAKANHYRAFELLDTLNLPSKLSNQCFQIKARHAFLLKNIRQGVLINNEKIVEELNKINKSLLDFVSDVDYEIDNQTNTTCKQIPRNYIVPISEKRKVFNFIHKNIKQGGIIVIDGPSGTGKSSFATYTYNSIEHQNISSEWIDSHYPFDVNNLNKSSQQNKIIVIDDLNLNHSLFQQNYFKQKINSIIIITTCERAVVDSIKTCCNFHGNHFINLSFSGFTQQQAFSFLRRSISENYIDNSFLTQLASSIAAMPILCQLVADVILDYDLDDITIHQQVDFLTLDDNKKVDNTIANPKINITELNTDKGLYSLTKTIIEKWYETKNVSDTEKTILLVLSEIPVVGMSFPALQYVLEEEHQLIDGLNQLKKRGIIKVLCNRQVKGEQIIQVHDIIKKFKLKHKERISPLKEKYLDYIKISSEKSNIDITTKIDILILKIKSAFERWAAVGNNNDFNQVMENQLLLLNKLIPVNANSQIKSKWIAEVFEPIIEDPKVTCPMLIGLGQAISNLKPYSIAGDIVWGGRLNKDGWARACCIHAAIHHWAATLTDNQKEKKKEELVFWLKFEIWKAESTPYYNYQYYSLNNGPDLDIAACLVGLCRLGYVRLAMKLTTSSMFKKRIPYTQVSILGVLLFLIDHEPFEVRSFFNRHIKNIKATSTRDALIEYATSKGIKLQSPKEKISCLDEKPLGQSLAKMANSHGFYHFLMLRNENITYV